MTAGSTLAIEATGLTKSFGDTRAVAGIDLAVPAGAGPHLRASSSPDSKRTSTSWCRTARWARAASE